MFLTFCFVVISLGRESGFKTTNKTIPSFVLNFRKCK